MLADATQHTTPTAEPLNRWSTAAVERFARQAAQAREPEQLWRLTAAHLDHLGRRPSAHTARAYRRAINELLLLFPDLDLLQPSPDAGQAYRAALAEGARPAVHETHDDARRGRRPVRGPLAPATIDLRLAAIRALYAALRWSGASDADPFSDVHARDSHEMSAAAPLPTYTDYELIELLGHARDHDDRLVVLLGAHAGLRVSEMLTLRWEDVALDAQAPTLRLPAPGNVQIDLSPPLAAALRAAAPTAGSTLTPPHVVTLRSQFGIYRRLRRLCERANVTFRGVHALRHAAGTRLLRSSGDVERVRQQLRHATLEMARRYAAHVQGPKDDD